MRFKLYQDTKQEWRWTLYADNGEPLAVSSEGYVSKSSAVDCARLVQNPAVAAARIERSEKIEPVPVTVKYEVLEVPAVEPVVQHTKHANPEQKAPKKRGKAKR